MREVNDGPESDNEHSTKNWPHQEFLSTDN